MGIFDDYISGLEGKTELNIVEVVADLARIHNEELSTVNNELSSANAKIATQSDELAVKNTELTEAQAEIKSVKTANYDLIMSTGIGREDDANPPSDDRVIDASNITIDDLFEKVD